MTFPIEICFPCPDCNKWTKHRLVGEHHFYLVYECEICDRRVLILKSIVWQYIDFKPCEESK